MLHTHTRIYIISEGSSQKSLFKSFKSIKICFPEVKRFLILKMSSEKLCLMRKRVSEQRKKPIQIALLFLFCGWTAGFKYLDSWVLGTPAWLTQLLIPPRSKNSALCSLQCLALSDKMFKARNALCSVWTLSSHGTCQIPACPGSLGQNTVTSCFLSSVQSWHQARWDFLLVNEHLLRHLAVEIACKYNWSVVQPGG